MFAINRPRMDAVGLIMLVALPLTGVTLAGFGDANMVLLGALFVIGEGLVRTGVVKQLGDRLPAQGGAKENRLLVLLMAAVAGLGAFMSSTGVVVIFIPVAPRIAPEHRQGPEPAHDAALRRGADQRHADLLRTGGRATSW